MCNVMSFRSNDGEDDVTVKRTVVWIGGLQALFMSAIIF